jgi:hypothetical protein
VKPAIGTVLCALLLVACGGTKAQPKTTSPAAAPPAVTTSTPATGPSGLQAEATAAAQGDIPDNQVFLTYNNPHAGYTMKYPEGWAQTGSANKVTIRDNNNIVRVEVLAGSLPSSARAKSELKATRIVTGPTKITIGGKPAIKVTYTTQSASNPVTGKRVTLVTDRYYLSNGSKEAILDLGTPQGVDNVDAYRLMIESFRWK